MKNREYQDRGGVLVCAAPAEYGLFDGHRLIVRILRMGDGWRVCRPTERSTIGLAISPIGMNKFREVREWAIANVSAKSV
ncbi:MAG TPA: hypothetical protein VGO43_11830 [Pyrinomonadaceae bacterium]|nr:hypothetical protein [Pyrinomonadaceae bacterium]